MTKLRLSRIHSVRDLRLVDLFSVCGLSNGHDRAYLILHQVPCAEFVHLFYFMDFLEFLALPLELSYRVRCRCSRPLKGRQFLPRSVFYNEREAQLFLSLWRVVEGNELLFAVSIKRRLVNLGLLNGLRVNVNRVENANFILAIVVVVSARAFNDCLHLHLLLIVRISDVVVPHGEFKFEVALWVTIVVGRHT